MRIRTNWILTAVIVLLAAYAASGFYFIQPEELGVVRWFGRAPEWSRRVPPGLHYALPWPFCRVDQPTTSEVRRVYVGLLPERREAIARGEVASLTASPVSDMLTGDVNILKITMVVQYQVIDPAAYLFVAEDPDKLVRDTVQAELIDALAVLPVDAALTVAKSELQRLTRERAQAVLERYGCGVLLTDTTLEAIDPPRAIIAAF
ncbi:MAG: hypothetical protein JXO22_14755, partial [Phycisphaerae bacterium]|nr:hypothetical protein [Phycisphaerae bacterium]